ncbi:NADH:ubiquinone reductase [Striga asiatica]|uniref:NADH:ubiquinone reductase n=1 Tax=Striga asiatica TaxID=4170 RepID=A0A5A7P518_STRAF|nr:NADH:ubiquinone reductase [Striga asiatica]
MKVRKSRQTVIWWVHSRRYEGTEESSDRNLVGSFSASYVIDSFTKTRYARLKEDADGWNNAIAQFLETNRVVYEDDYGVHDPEGAITDIFALRGGISST